MVEVVQVKLREGNEISYYNTNNLRVGPGVHVIVEVDRGMDYGVVVSEPQVVLESDVKQELRKIERIADKRDLRQIEENKKRIKHMFKACERKIADRRMDMKLVDAEYSFDHSKIIFYFVTIGRIVHHALVHGVIRSSAAPTGWKALRIFGLPYHIIQKNVCVCFDIRILPACFQ